MAMTPPRRLAVRQCGRQGVEIGDGTCKAGQANDRQRRRGPRAVFAHMQPQSVLRGYK